MRVMKGSVWLHYGTLILLVVKCETASGQYKSLIQDPKNNGPESPAHLFQSSFEEKFGPTRRKGAAPVQVTQVSKSCLAATNLSFCYVLVGAAFSTNSSSTKPLDQVTIVDSFVANAYTQASSSAGWTWNGQAIKVAGTAACRMAFSSYFCLNPQIISSFGLNGTCGMPAGTSFIPCNQRCLQYQISCLGMSSSAASAACQAASSSSPPMNTASDSKCFCGDNFQYGASPYDVCAGPCDPYSECGSCPTIPTLKTCYTLVGTALSASNASQTVQGQAIALDSYVAAAYASATSPAGWAFNSQSVQISTPSTACRVAFSSYFCSNPVVLQSFGLNGNCGMTPPTTFTPCLQRCIMYQISCLGAASVAAARASCTAAALVSGGWNSADNRNCFCGDNLPYGGNPFDVCEGPCDPQSECGACPSLTSMSTCNVLTGTSLSTTSTTSYPLAQALAVDAAVAAGYTAATTSAAGWALGAQSFSFPGSAACRTAFSSYLCLSPALLAGYGLNGSCGVPPNVSFAPCRH